jgi:phosphatidylglycerol---prolipoprotein diacylglyceryl transferase
VLPALIQIFPPPGLPLGPVTIPFYGLGYAIALAAGVWLATREARWRGLDVRHIGDGVLLVVLFGIVGARLYHVIDEWERYAGNVLAIVLPPYSGLGLFGGVFGGMLGLVVFTRRRGLSFFRWVDVAAPGFLIGQTIARWGNFFNQELYGPPTDLPWGITIDCAHRVPIYPCATFPETTTGFHPLFLYESLLNLVGLAIALLISRRLWPRLRDGDLLAFWLLWYGSVRLVLEPFRSGWNWTAGGIPVAQIVSLGVIVAAIVLHGTRDRRARSSDVLEPDADPALLEEEGPEDADEADADEADVDDDAAETAAGAGVTRPTGQ